MYVHAIPFQVTSCGPNNCLSALRGSKSHFLVLALPGIELGALRTRVKDINHKGAAWHSG